MRISEDQYYQRLWAAKPATVKPLQAFLVKAEALGVRPEFLDGLNLRYRNPAGGALNLGAINTSGGVDTLFFADQSRWRYNEALALGIGGTVKEARNRASYVKTAAGKRPTLADLLPQHEQMWLDAMSAFIEAFDRGQGAASPDTPG